MVASFERLYYADSYQTAFTAAVVQCHPKGLNFQVVLDQTAFYPEGGGQPADTGMLGDARVLDVHEADGLIYHTTDKALSVGTQVEGRIDWDRRFMLMQQHSGEHILSGVVKSLYGFENVGFHIGSDSMTIDFSGELSDEDLADAERLSNEAVYQNGPVQVSHPTLEERSTIDYRSKIELGDDVRLVTIPGSDCCACCGTHVRRTGEIGVIKVLSRQKYKGGTRVSVVCGRRALADYVRKNDQANAISSILSLKPGELTEGIVRLQSETAVLKSANSLLRERIVDLKVQSAIIGSGRSCLFEEEMTPDELRSYSLKLASRSGDTVAVFSGRDGERYRYALCSKVEDMRLFSRQMNTVLKGAGGGSPELVQGSVSANRREIEIYFL